VRASKDVARVAIEAIRAQGRLVSRGWADLALIDDRDDCFAVGEVNQQALFGRVAAVVHHGGAGTTTTATRAGAPQVVVPQVVDQPYWAGRVADLGIGTAHDGPTPTTESLSAALRRSGMPASAITSRTPMLIAVSANPGHSALTAKLSPASTGPRERARPTTACLVAQYTGSSGAAVSPARLAVKTIVPLPRAVRAGSAAWTPKTTPSTLRTSQNTNAPPT